MSNVNNDNWSRGTICVQGGYCPSAGEPRVLPISQSTTYKYEDPDQVTRLFDLEEVGHMYSRISNPTVEAFEKKICALEGGVGAVATASGQSATLLAVLNICECGDHLIAASTLYGGTFNLLKVTLKKLGISVTLVDPDLSGDEIKSFANDRTRAVFGETIGNPGLNVLDFKKFAGVAEDLGVPFIVDNTLATPCLCRPFELGANIVVHSTTKYTDGHATSVGGVVIDGGNFNWDNGKFPELIEPDPTYHGVSYLERFGCAAYITKVRTQLLRDIGNCMSPFNAFLNHLGLETLHLRMKRHSSNAFALAKWLDGHDLISWVNYPLFGDGDNADLAKVYLKDGGSGILSFGIKGGTNEAKLFMKSLKLTALVVHLGDARTSILHPATTTHRQLSLEEQLASGVAPDLLRVSVGIEDAEDIINDFDQALECLRSSIL